MALRIRYQDGGRSCGPRWARAASGAVTVGVAFELLGAWACGPRPAAPAPASAPAPAVASAFAAPAPAGPPIPVTVSTAPPAMVIGAPAAPAAPEAKAPAPAAAPAAFEVDRSLEMSSTAYCLRGAMRTGVRTRNGMAAADPSVIPLGSVVRVSHPDGRLVGLFVVMDTGGAVRGNKLDIYMESCAEARAWGRKPVVAEVIGIGRR